MKLRLFLFLFIAALLLVLGTIVAACGDGEEEAGVTVEVIGGVVIPKEGSPTEGGFALEGEDVVSPGPAITVRAGEPVTITFKVVDEIVPEPHDFVIVAEKVRFADPLWGAKTEPLPFGEQQSITFTPDTPGSYFYICSVSDHLFLGMWGSFIVEE